VNRDLAFAHELADLADAVTLARFRAHDLKVETKADSTPVSEADHAAEQLIRERIAASGRREGVLGEEFGDDGGDPRWIVDPIDGTRNFVRGIPVWATLLALERDGQVDVAVVSAPALRRRWWAVRGGGAFADAEQCRVSAIRRVEECAMSSSDCDDLSVAREGYEQLTRRAWMHRGLGDFWQHCLVAEGSLDIGMDSVLQVWDFAPLVLIVEEAGGRATTFAGTAPAGGESFVTSNGLLHEEVVALLDAATGSARQQR
jgi:histidinol-phosphatase